MSAATTSELTVEDLVNDPNTIKAGLAIEEVDGRRAAPSMVLRLIVKGVGGIKLPAVLKRNQWETTPEAYRQFLCKVSALRAAGTARPVSIPTVSRAALEHAGLASHSDSVL